MCDSRRVKLTKENYPDEYLILDEMEEPSHCHMVVGKAIWDEARVKEINLFQQQIMLEIEMGDIGLLTFYLGIQEAQEDAQIVVKQSTYTKKVLTQFVMAECNVTKTPMKPKTYLYKNTMESQWMQLNLTCSWLLEVLTSHPSKFMKCSQHAQQVYGKTHNNVLQDDEAKFEVHFNIVYGKNGTKQVITNYSNNDLSIDTVK